MGQRPLPRPRQTDTSSAKVIAAILFVVLLIVIFGQRILSAGLDEELASPERSRDRRGQANTPVDGKEDPASLEIDYPERCLKPAPEPEGFGLIAAERPDGISVAAPTGGSPVSIRSSGPVGWSPSGRFLATGRGEIWTATGEQVLKRSGGGPSTWAWSPIADCLVLVGGGEMLVFAGNKPSFAILAGRVATFSFSPDGTKLMVVMSDPKRGGIWLADLEAREMTRILDAKEARGRWVLNGWSRAERPILIRPAGITEGSGPPKVSFLPPSASTTCGDEIVVVENGKLATFGVTGPPKFLAADDTYRYLAATCAPNNQFIAAVRVLKGAGPDAARLVLLDRDGSFINPLTQGLYRDDSPSWGPARTGIILIRRQLGAGEESQQVWFLPEGGVVQQIGLPVISTNGIPVFDWSADGVLGHPIDS